MPDLDELENGDTVTVVATVTDCNIDGDGITLSVKFQDQKFSGLEHNTPIRSGTGVPVRLMKFGDSFTAVLLI